LGNLSIQQFGSRDEEEVAGYASIMNLIFESYQDIPPTYFLQFIHFKMGMAD
jgi:hypothetical protein